RGARGGQGTRESMVEGRLPTRRSIRIGLTGPIGCGKPTVAGWLAARGAAVVDADAIAREVTNPGEPTLDAVWARFGLSVRRPDGTLDRAALGRIVFSDPSALGDLEAIIHPAVRPRIELAVGEAEGSGSRVVVIEAIKLVEAGYAAQCDEVWLVLCDPANQRERLLGRGAPEQRRRRWRRESPRPERRRAGSMPAERGFGLSGPYGLGLADDPGDGDAAGCCVGNGVGTTAGPVGPLPIGYVCGTGKP